MGSVFDSEEVKLAKIKSAEERKKRQEEQTIQMLKWGMPIFIIVIMVVIGPLVWNSIREEAAKTDQKMTEAKLRKSGEVQAYIEYGDVHTIFYERDGTRNYLIITKTREGWTVSQKANDDINLTEGDSQ